jgi:hypothetical protein
MSDKNENFEVRELSASELDKISGGTGSSGGIEVGDLMTDYKCSCGNMEMRAIEVTDDYAVFECTACHRKIRAIPSKPAIKLNKS